MKTLLVLIACALCAGHIMAGDYFTVKLTVAAGATSASSDVDMSTYFGDKAMFVERVTAAGISGTATGVVTFASIDHGVATTLVASGNLVTGSLYAGYPTRTIDNPILLQNIVVTSNVPIRVTSTNTVSTSALYIMKTVRVGVAQLAHPTAAVYNAVIFVKND